MKYIRVAVPDDFDDYATSLKIEYPVRSEGVRAVIDGQESVDLSEKEPVYKIDQAEIWRPEYRKVLDHGFIGLVDFMGGDHTVVDAARMSYGTGTRRVQEDRGLIRYLIRHRHWTPVEMPEFMWHVKAPIFVFRQWHRHRMASINEYSARYSVLSDKIYMPDQDVLKPQSSTNKQGRGGEMSEENAYACQLQMTHAYQEAVQAYRYLLGETTTPSNSLLRRRELVEDFALQAVKRLQEINPDWSPELVTDQMIDDKMKEISIANGLMFTDAEFYGEDGEGLSRELARVVMPMGTYSEMYWKSDLRNTFNFLSLRCDPHAQYEIRVYADAMLERLQPLAPVCIAAFMDYQLQGRSMSRMELDVIRKLYSVAADGDSSVAHTIEETMKEAGASIREVKEFIDALNVPSTIE